MGVQFCHHERWSNGAPWHRRAMINFIREQLI
jgi:hypothetical protein